MAKESFFEERSQQSRVKAQIVQKYFFAWANVMKSSARKKNTNIAYIDLFSGPGRYKDGSTSVPLMILEKAIEDPFFREHLVTIFNDLNSDNAKTLDREINALPGVDRLANKPLVMNESVGEEIVKVFESIDLVPTLFFIDPWGYKGLSLQLINSVLRNWGCDCVFFFNYNRVNMGINNPYVEPHMAALFGEKRVRQLRSALEGLTPRRRELMVVEKISEALRDMGGNYTLPFNFKNSDGSRTSHYLIFVSKHVRGYEIMKDIMAKESSQTNQGVATFSYCPADEDMPMLLELSQPLEELKRQILEYFRGRSVRMDQVYHEHHVGRPYIKSNYKNALLDLENQGYIITDPPADKRRKNTIADHVTVKVPGNGNY